MRSDPSLLSLLWAPTSSVWRKTTPVDPSCIEMLATQVASDLVREIGLDRTLASSLCDNLADEIIEIDARLAEQAFLARVSAGLRWCGVVFPDGVA